jgi:hypothetical protein
VPTATAQTDAPQAKAAEAMAADETDVRAEPSRRMPRTPVSEPAAEGAAASSAKSSPAMVLPLACPPAVIRTRVLVLLLE